MSVNPFDFDAAVSAPFRMQPGLRRLPEGATQLTPLAPGSRHQREKLAVLSAYWQQALQQQSGFDPAPALDTLCRHAAAEHPQAWAWDGTRAQALQLGAVVTTGGDVEQLQAGVFGLGDEVTRCLHGLPAAWRLAGLLGLAFAEDLAVVDGQDGTIPWLAVCLPSHWAPEEKVGRHFAQIHAPVADNARLLKASDQLMRLICGPARWERFVWNVTDQPCLHAHPAHMAEQRWQQTPVEQAWFRSERQTFIPVAGNDQSLFTILVQVQPLAEVLDTPARAQALHDAIASMSPQVLTYRNLHAVREPLLRWLNIRTQAAVA